MPSCPTTIAPPGEPCRPPEAVCKLPSFPPVAARLMQLLARPDVQVSEVVRLIRSDAAFGAEILQLANSPLYACSCQVSTLAHAVALIGLERTKALALTVALKTPLKGALKLSTMRRCWRHTVASAIIAERLAPALGAPPDIAYTSAIVHDLGRLGFLAAYREKYGDLLTRPYGNPAELMAAECASFDVDHCEAGAWLARSWGFPHELWTSARSHHLPTTRADGPSVHGARLACRLATLAGFASVQYDDPVGPEEADSYAALLHARDFAAGLAALSELVEVRIGALD